MLCQFATTFPSFVADFLNRGRAMSRRFREATITDLMMGILNTIGAGRVIVDFPNETMTGADMQWDFVNLNDGTFFRVLLQAKQAYGEGLLWRRHSYRQLHHTTGSGSKFQAEILCDTARKATTATYPLYIFYNPQQTCALANESGRQNVVGVMIADGYFIESLVKMRISRYRSLGAIAPCSFPLKALFCPPIQPSVVATGTGQSASSTLASPTPRDVRNRLIQIQPPFAPFRLSSRVVDIDQLFSSMPHIPDVAEMIPTDVQATIQRRSESDTHEPPERLDRWRVTFISGGEAS